MSRIFWRSAVTLALTCVSLSAVSARAELGVNDFKGSSFVYSNTMSLTSLDQGSEMTYNPYYGMQFTVAPRYWFLDRSFVSARVTFDKELTEPDDTTYKGETRIGDLNLGLGSILHTWGFGLTTFGALSVQLPTSLASQARTMKAGTRATVAFNQALGGIGSIGYNFSAGRSFFSYTTGELESPRVSGCASSTVGCDPFLNTGVRNAPWQLIHGLSVNLFPLSWLFVSASTSWIESYLFPIKSVDPLVTYTPQDPTNKRVAMSYGLEVDLQPQQWLIIALMLNTFNPQLAPNSTYYQPFINRFTVAQVDLRFTLGVFRVAQASSDDDPTEAPKTLKKETPPKKKPSSETSAETARSSGVSQEGEG